MNKIWFYSPVGVWIIDDKKRFTAILIVGLLLARGEEAAGNPLYTARL